MHDLYCLFCFVILAVGILSLSKCSLSIGLFCVRHTWFALSVFFKDRIFCSRQLKFLAYANIFDQLDCFVRTVWVTLSVFFCDENFLLNAVRIFRSANIFEQLYCFVRHACFALSVFFCDGKFLIGTGGILSWCKVS